jgi:hypothetical protein
MTRSRFSISMAFVGLFSAIPAWSHHSFAAEFDRNKVIKLQGTIISTDWVNPHAWIHLAAKNPDGTATEWLIEVNTPNALQRRGFTKQMLEQGTEVVVQAYQAKSGENKANGSSMTFKDGRTLSLGSSSGDEGPKPAPSN